MQVLYCAVSVFALVGFSSAYNSGFNKIYVEKKVHAIPGNFSVYNPPMRIFYMVQFPEISWRVSLLLVHKKHWGTVSKMTNCYNMNFTPQMNKTLSLANNPDICRRKTDGKSYYIRCDGDMYINQYSDGYFFALSNCAGAWGLQNTTYELTSRDVPVVVTSSSANQFTSLLALFLVIALILFY